MLIQELKARKVFNSRGEETIEIEIFTEEAKGRFAAPAGTSKGKYEVVDFPKGSVNIALKKVKEEIAPKIIGRDILSQSEIDLFLHEIDGTPNFSNIGGNVAYAISMAVAEAFAKSMGVPLYQYLAEETITFAPYPLGNIISGGVHVGRGAPTIQEFLAIPIGAPSFYEALKANIVIHSRVYSLLKRIDPSFLGGMSCEGAWIANIKDEDALKVISKACEEVSNELGFSIKIGIDVASSSFWDSKNSHYVYHEDIKRTEQQFNFIVSLIDFYSLFYVEDPFHEDDFESFSSLVKTVGGKCLVCGDDLFATNKERLLKGINLKAANSVIIKPNQIGTLTNSIEAIKLAKRKGIIPIISHRSGETIDWHLSHICVAYQCPMMKIGVRGGERVSKTNELLRICERENLKFTKFQIPSFT